MRLIQGFSMLSVPFPFVIFLKFPCLPSQRFTSRSIMSRSAGFTRFPNSEEESVRAHCGNHIDSPVSSFISKASFDSAKALDNACQVTMSGPNLIPGIFRKRAMAISAVVDFATIPGGATMTIYIFTCQRNSFMSIHTRLLRAPAIADTPDQKCIRAGASLKLAYWTYAVSQSGKFLAIFDPLFNSAQAALVFNSEFHDSSGSS